MGGLGYTVELLLWVRDKMVVPTLELECQVRGGRVSRKTSVRARASRLHKLRGLQTAQTVADPQV